MSKIAPITVVKYTLSVEGFTIRYLFNRGCTILNFDPFATCGLFEELGLIEGFDSDGYEPVVLFTHPEVKPYGHELWCHFVRSCPLSEAVVTRIAACHYLHRHKPSEEGNEHRKEYQNSEASLLASVTPPVKLYHLHNFYYEHISTRESGRKAGAAVKAHP